MLQGISNDIKKINEMTYEEYKDKYNINDLEEWKEVVEYIFKKTLGMASFLIIVYSLIIVLNLSSIKLSIFLITFFLLRTSWGGMHFENEKICFLASIIITLLSLKIKLPHYMLIQIVSSIFLMKIGVVDNRNRVLEREMKLKFKKRGILVLYLLFLTNLLLREEIISIAILLITLSCLTGKFKNKEG